MYVTARQRLTSAIAAAGMLALIAAMVIFGLAVGSDLRPTVDRLTTIAVAAVSPPTPEPREKPRPRRRSAAKDEASPANLRNRATAVIAPIVPSLMVPPPVIAAPQPGTGDASNNGASDRIGTGQGAGGEGDGLGGGGDGDGDGDYTAPVLVSRDLRMSDLPRDMVESDRGARLEARYRVYADGRTGECIVTVSSGRADFDRTVCQLIEQRFRYRPSRDDRGTAVASTVERRFSWSVDRTAMEAGGD